MEDSDAAAAIGGQRLAVAIADIGREGVEIATEAEDAGVPRAEDDIFERLAHFRLQRPDMVAPAVEIDEQVGIERRAPAELHEGPDGGLRDVVGALDLPQIAPESPRVPRGRKRLLSGVGAGNRTGGQVVRDIVQH